MPQEFHDARRVLTSLLAPVEKRCLVWMAARLPPWIGSDHLTALALAAMVAAGVSYGLSRVTPVGLLLVNLSLAVNWFGDSLDGTLARVRRQPRPRYGFYVDHVIDAFGAAWLLGGLAVSGYMSPLTALALLAAYLLLCVELYLAAYSLRTFTMSFLKVGPTELRILLAAGNGVLLVHPSAELFGRTFLLFDVAGIVSIAALLATFAVSAVANTRALYRAEPLKERVEV